MAKSKKKRINPRRLPVSKADIDKAKATAIDIAVTRAWALFFLALGDVFGFGKTRMMRLWKRINEYSEDVVSGELDVEEVIQVLNDEYGIHLVD